MRGALRRRSTRRRGRRADRQPPRRRPGRQRGLNDVPLREGLAPQALRRLLLPGPGPPQLFGDSRAEEPQVPERRPGGAHARDAAHADEGTVRIRQPPRRRPGAGQAARQRDLEDVPLQEALPPRAPRLAAPSWGTGAAGVGQRRPCWQHPSDAAHADDGTVQVVSHTAAAVGASVASKTLRYLKLWLSKPSSAAAPRAWSTRAPQRRRRQLSRRHWNTDPAGCTPRTQRTPTRAPCGSSAAPFVALGRGRLGASGPRRRSTTGGSVPSCSRLGPRRCAATGSSDRPGRKRSGDTAHADAGTEQFDSHPAAALGIVVASKTFRYGELWLLKLLSAAAPRSWTTCASRRQQGAEEPQAPTRR